MSGVCMKVGIGPRYIGITVTVSIAVHARTISMILLDYVKMTPKKFEPES